MFRLSGNNAELIIDMGIGPKSDGKLEVTTFDFALELDTLKAELECLFPRNGRCCPRKYLKSCNTILAKTVLRYEEGDSMDQINQILNSRFINSDGKKFIKNFQPEITKQLGPILKNYINT